VVCRAQESTRNRNTERKEVLCRHGTTSDRSSSESYERRHRGEKYDGHQRTKHGRGDKHAEEKRSENYSGKCVNAADSDSTKDRSDQGRRAESKYHHSKQIDETGRADSRIHGEMNRQETESRKKRKQSDSVEVCTTSTDSEFSSSMHTNKDDGNSKQKQARAELDQTAVQSKTARQTVGTAFENAHARYLARKGKSSTPVVCEDSE